MHESAMPPEGTKRPPRLGQPSKLKHTTALMVRVTDEQRRLFERKAAIDGLSVSAWARMILLREAKAGDRL
jgi:hypothetical protein